MPTKGEVLRVYDMDGGVVYQGLVADVVRDGFEVDVTLIQDPDSP